MLEWLKKLFGNTRKKATPKPLRRVGSAPITTPAIEPFDSISNEAKKYAEYILEEAARQAEFMPVGSRLTVKIEEDIPGSITGYDLSRAISQWDANYGLSLITMAPWIGEFVFRKTNGIDEE